MVQFVRSRLMDFVTAWKIASIVFTGGFGILGLLKDYKDKKTNKITKWGRISLAGILVSSLLGMAAQLKESSEQERAREATAKQTLALARNTDNAVKQIQRVLSQLDNPEVSLIFHVPCTNQKFAEFCRSFGEGLNRICFMGNGGISGRMGHSRSYS